ncbi:hypothetical protein DNI29_04260 [Hymenobacter sediminis]|uniref:hypothetical protein n=1 Tax=Hymenobacter sediminis TaxID=2218621 RepID=UPI000F515721|nr:hypothetical protein [Hymenobacter sediminis]RPD50016.1 hypothetical protein DNI29_04260 [Hymenobacter sediminis]
MKAQPGRRAGIPTLPQKTQAQKADFEKKLARIRPQLPKPTVAILCAIRPDLDPERVQNVLRTPIRRYDDEILKALTLLAGPLRKPSKATA